MERARIIDAEIKMEPPNFSVPGERIPKNVILILRRMLEEGYGKGEIIRFLNGTKEGRAFLDRVRELFGLNEPVMRSPRFLEILEILVDTVTRGRVSDPRSFFVGKRGTVDLSEVMDKIVESQELGGSSFFVLKFGKNKVTLSIKPHEDRYVFSTALVDVRKEGDERLRNWLAKNFGMEAVEKLDRAERMVRLLEELREER